MSRLAFISSLASNLYRIIAFVFLRVIPARLAQFILPGLFVLYLVAEWLTLQEIQPPAAPSHLEKKEDSVAKPLPEVPQQLAFREILAVLFSLPSKFSRTRAINLALNATLFFAAVDLTLTPFLDIASDVVFTRVGAIQSNSAKIVVRYPQANVTSASVQIMWRKAVADEVWKGGPFVHLTEENDWTGTTKIEDIWPSTRYEYHFASEGGEILPYPVHPIQFKTFPDPQLEAGNTFRFLASSCITPNFPYGGPHNRRTIRGFDLMANYLFPGSQATVSTEMSSASNDFGENGEEQPAQKKYEDPLAEFLIFLGDFIYADVPVYIGDDKEAYRRLYRRNYNSPSFRKIYERLPIFHTYDDHEIINNYAGQGNDSLPPFQSAANAFELYNADANYDPLSPGKYYYDFQYGDTSFFVLDTRRYRSAPEDKSENRTMLGNEQLAALGSWLSDVNDTAIFKFVVSSVPFTSLFGIDAQIDSWAGFFAEKSLILDMFHYVPNLFIISGDRHEFAHVEFRNPAPARNVYEISTSPLSMFYIPLIHPLRPFSPFSLRAFEVLHEDNTTTESGENATHTIEHVPFEMAVKYIPEGNYKWTTFDVDTTDLERPILKIELFVDGESAYTWDYVGTPVRKKSKVASLGTFAPNGLQDFLRKFGLDPKKWFESITSVL